MSFSPTLGRWTQADPKGYVDGLNTYQAYQLNPATMLDPMGLQAEVERKRYNDLGLDASIGAYLNFWTEWLGLADNNRNPIGDDCKKKLKCMVRAILWVESKHGTAGANHPGRDPMQVGNPADPAWAHISNQPDLVKGGQLGPRPIRRGDRPGVGWADLPAAVAREPMLPNGIDPTNLPRAGHRDPKFDQNMSVFWGILWYLYTMNQQDKTPNGPRAAWNCQDCSWDHLTQGAVDYNGEGNPNYRQEIEEALRLSGCRQ
jgi:hypothetical protein